MAQSDDVNASGGLEFDREKLPEGHARFVLREENVTVTFEGAAEEVHERFLEHVAESSGISLEELTEEISELTMPKAEEDLIPADEFYE